MTKRVAIQGYKGAFHEIAAREYFKSPIEIVYCDTFEQEFELLKANEVDFIAMAIENSIAGSLLANFTLLRRNDAVVIGEQYLHITQNLMALPGTNIDDLVEVYSHPIAIQQSLEFFKQYPKIKLIESIDTALSAEEVSTKQLKNTGAIASVLAAEMYGLEILASSVETHKRNFTRFLMITKPDSAKIMGVSPTKASLCFTLPHEEGSLSGVLAIFSSYHLSLTKIQSMPIVGREFEYFFYVDVEFADYQKYKYAIQASQPLMHDLHILGEYERAECVSND